MEHEHVLSGLVRKRAEIAGRLEAAQDQVRQLILDVDAVDATIRLFAPDMDLAQIRPKPLPARHAAYRGEVSAIILGALRDASEPLTVAELTVRVMEARGLNQADAGLVLTGRKRVGAALRYLRRRERAQSCGTGWLVRSG